MRGARLATRFARTPTARASCSRGARHCALPAVTRGTASRPGSYLDACAISRGWSSCECSTTCQFRTKAMLRLGPLVVYPVELTHRAVTMPVRSDDGCDGRGERDESQSVRHVI